MKAGATRQEGAGNASAESPCYDDEIDLREIFQVLRRQKSVIFATAGVFLALAVIYTLVVTPLYEINIQVKSGLKGWSKEDIASWLKQNQYLSLYQEPGGEDLKKIRALKYKTERKGDVITLYMYWSDPRTGRLFLKDLTSRWIDYYLNKFPDEGIVLAQSEIEQKINALEQQLEKLNRINVSQLENRIAEKKRLIDLKKVYIETTKKDIKDKKALLKYLENTAKTVMTNTKALMKARDDLIIKEKQHDLSLLFLLNSIQQNISYADQVKGRMVDIQSGINEEQNEINSLKDKIEEIHNSISEVKLRKTVELQGKKRYLEKQIKDLRYQLAHVSPIKVLGPAASTLSPVKPKKTLIWSLSLACGLFIGIILAFLRPVLQNSAEGE